MSSKTKKNFLSTGSFVLGLGFMGAMDGIIFHQLLQWHSVIMQTDRPGQIVSDGVFHFGVTIALIIGGVLLWLAGRPTDISRGLRRLIGGFLTGAGIFNLLEGIVNHHLLQIHRVKPGDPNALMYDLAFLAIGLLLVIIGEAVRKKRPEPENTAEI
ncbi:DUF2243 domain-containing protein [Mesobacillus subterraneus]|jgi:uncharacterized membrane protein|uniref:DUF2243 domain-containing protein n=1 Tax=Mesobacillus subterraneus TaxID=285983 RepID=UPI00203CF206|nr:DUF2243 domain-containing protein [Mesobacillus subterraneus]MCM3664497.1 DUF2243 domain-containing protein [Mesobacillus subterraneus]MCM3683986.1 DUF2243 domain-containing protein [Mesobacillus subterraneus]